MTAKEEISAWIASCAENGIPHPCKQRGLQKKFYYWLDGGQTPGLQPLSIASIPHRGS